MRTLGYSHSMEVAWKRRTGERHVSLTLFRLYWMAGKKKRAWFLMEILENLFMNCSNVVVFCFVLCCFVFALAFT